MIKLFRFLKGSLISIMLIFVLLIIQAFCDLSLPNYTSNIVDVGIQQGGIESVVPLQIRQTEFDKIKLFLTEENAEKLSSYYVLDENNGILSLTENEILEEDLLSLEDIITKPILLVSMLKTLDTAETLPPQAAEFTKIMEALPEGTSVFALVLSLPLETRLEMLDDMTASVTEMGESLTNQMATEYIKAEYAAVGLDMDKLQMDYIFVSGAKMLGLALIMMIVAIAVGFLASRTGALFGMNLRETLFKKVLSFSNEEMEKFSTASLITRSTNDIQQLQFVIVMLLRMVLYAPILGIGGILKVMNTDTGMTWIIFVAVATLLIIISTLVSVAMPKFKIMQSLIDRLNAVAREILTGLPVIRAFSREEHEEVRFDKANTNLMKVQLFANRVMTFMFPVMMLIMNGVSILIVWNASKGIDSGIMQVGDMIAFITYTMLIVMSFLMLAMMSVMLPRAAVSAKRINEILSTENTIVDAKNTNDSITNGDISFNDVSFRYHDADEDTLKNITFTAKNGETTAFIGSTGSGKSTLINLIPRFFDVTEGTITIDGTDIRDMSQKFLRSNIGLVPQKGILFSGTISSNIKFGNPEASDNLMELSAKIAQAEDFIGEKDEKYNTEVAQGGTNVSGGQKQRLSIARAIAKQPKIYIFDDSFSALDYKTDKNLRKALSDNIKNATIIIVAQRISTILNAEKIVVLDDGNVAGIGTHSELMQNCEVYRQIAFSQLSEKELSKTGNFSSDEKEVL